MFHYKDRKDIWKGEGIYHVTFNVAGKESLLGELKAVPREMLRRYYKDEAKWRAIPAVNDKNEVAMVDLSPLGFAISEDLKLFGKRHEGIPHPLYSVGKEGCEAVCTTGIAWIPDWSHTDSKEDGRMATAGGW